MILPDTTGENNPQSKLTDSIVREIREKAKVMDKSALITEYSKKLNTSRDCIRKILRFERWTHVR